VCRSITSNTKTGSMNYLPSAAARRQTVITDVKGDGAKDVKWEVFSHVQNYAPS
jgi:hypothetical protein